MTRESNTSTQARSRRAAVRTAWVIAAVAVAVYVAFMVSTAVAQ